MGFRVIHGDGPLGDLNSTATSLPAGYTLGEARWDELGKKKYRLFYNASGASIPTGGVFAKGAAGSGVYSATTGTTETGATFAIGVNDLTVTVPTASYFWGVVWGHPVQVLASNISIATDEPVLMTSDFKVIPATIPTETPFAVNMGDLATATALTDACGTRFFVFFEEAYARVQTNAS